MDLAEIFRVMRRRWYVLFPGLLVTVALVVAVLVVVPTKYQSQSTVEMLNSQKATEAFDGNPFLSTQTSLTGMADSLARNLNSDASIADLKAQGLTGTYVAMIADNAQGPLLWLTATGTDPAAVLHSDTLLTAYAAQRLQQFQAQKSVPTSAMIQMTTIVPPQNPVAQLKTKIEYVIMAGLVGLVASLFGCFYIEARRRPRTVDPEAEEELAPVVDGEDEDDDQDDKPDSRPDNRRNNNRSSDRNGDRSDEHQSGGDGDDLAYGPAPRQRRRQDEDVEQPTVQLSVLQLQQDRAKKQSSNDTEAPWFAP
ncbi:chain length determinant protein [Streptacidiphilus sp. N1-12]|uniref:Chain length determinant protein n=2 Tax=Streptacidiphilus alkalitolerans TaxID=3342712 RepID=A0ABV6WHT5_9ACTN